MRAAVCRARDRIVEPSVPGVVYVISVSGPNRHLDV